MKYQDLHIPQPCHESWEAMEATEQGRFCQSCKKEVIDFTFKTEREFNAIIASGTWSGCGRFLVKQLGKAAAEEARASQVRRLILERWRKGAAAAALLVGLWQIPNMGKAATKEVICLVPSQEPDANAQQQPEANYFVSAVLLSEYGESLPMDFWINLHLPSGELIPVLTHNGFFGIDLQGKALPEDTIRITVPAVEREDSAFKMKIEFTEFQFQLAQGQNIQKSIHAIFQDKIRATVMISGGPVGLKPIDLVTPSIDVLARKSQVMEPELEPLFKPKTPEEKAEARAAREAKKSNANRP